jgi:predicted regulator of Ras-like GTPase activity (Roadblock/LC7/MglB family)
MRFVQTLANRNHNHKLIPGMSHNAAISPADDDGALTLIASHSMSSNPALLGC